MGSPVKAKLCNTCKAININDMLANSYDIRPASFIVEDGIGYFPIPKMGSLGYWHHNSYSELESNAAGSCELCVAIDDEVYYQRKKYSTKSILGDIGSYLVCLVMHCRSGAPKIPGERYF